MGGFNQAMSEFVGIIFMVLGLFFLSQHTLLQEYENILVILVFLYYPQYQYGQGCCFVSINFPLLVQIVAATPSGTRKVTHTTCKTASVSKIRTTSNLSYVGHAWPIHELSRVDLVKLILRVVLAYRVIFLVPFFFM